MAYLVRKIVINRWPDGKNSFFTNKDELPADTIVTEFKTSNNTLSWWRIEDIKDIKDLGISFVSKLNMGQKNIRLIAFPFDQIEKKFVLEHTPENGDTALLKYKDCHYDMCKLNYAALGELGELIAKATTQEDNNFIVKINVESSIEAIKKLYDAGGVDGDLLGTYIKQKLGIEPTAC